ncbi:Outer membrane protein transport protein (OMPP1/FadL/TodX) [Bernardetia litoralis DSM 6794]|uniref:Outer membrane protein transport protein (OMPP1/FadL/TodX) n=1 Tax=Bernardetia litoralis (strain ATCC 23117 / DSM 6794 / NBRC 15988 / NCIMB 1366 / Fx l1 / Sio-4) TaxID=880071 RepID=I4AHQ0_BERLS|nr:protein transporter [Bernardetia litoralis]AFM03485.1 Outer membrane protein transport protein (OMPP1/FadL/TodX) [Bernardetia litoralis DSM 6794]
MNHTYKLYKIKLSKLIGCLALVALVGHSNLSSAQIAQGSFGYYADANRFAQTIPTMGANARIQGIGGAATAIGGDISSASVNPAGLGYLKRSEITFSPSLSFLGSDATYNSANQNTLTEDAKLNFNFAQLGAAFLLPSDNSSGYKGGAFSVSYSRLNSFQRRTSYEGTNSENSIIDYFLNQADGISWSSIYPSGGATDLLALAYDAYLINEDFDYDNGGQNTYYSFVPVAPTLQREVIEYSGSQSQWNFSYGGNYDDKLFFGAALGIQSFRYKESKRYEEIVTGEPTDASQVKSLNSLVIGEDLSISGTGVNFTAGVIYRPIYAVRLGASFTTPTYFSVTDTYNANLSALYNNYNFGEDESGNPIILNDVNGNTLDLESTYNMTTPLRASLGAAFFVGKLGFISADVDFINYESSKLLSPPQEFSFTADNQTIKNLYASTMNYRLGAELRIETFYLRAGVGLYGNTIKEEFRQENEDAFQTRISGGLGIHKESFYIDLAVVQQANNTTYTPYNLSDNSNPTVDIKNTTTNVVATVGFHF